MIELIAIAVGVTSAFIFLTHATDANGIETVSRRFNVTAINPSRALRHARAMLEDWKKRHPIKSRVRVLNNKGEEIYSVTGPLTAPAKGDDWP